jgi:hypothetical protein
MARPFLQIEVTIPEGLLHGEWSGPLGAQRCLPLLLLHDHRSWWLFILLLHRNLRHAIGKVPIGSGGERPITITIVTSSPLLEDGRAREERWKWKLQRLPVLLIAICSSRTR